MPKKKSLLHLGLLPAVILLGVQLNAPVATQGQSISQTNRSSSGSTSLSLRDELQIEFKSPPSDGIPNESEIGGTRGNCDSANADERRMNLTPVLPATRDRQFYAGLTVAENPTLFVFVPRTSATKAQFSLYDDENGTQELYEATFPLSNTPGIISITIPEQPEKNLEVGHRYLWGFSLVCPTNSKVPDAAANPTIFGIIERTEVSPDLFSAIDSEASLNNALLYAELGIWHETLMTLARLRQSEPDNVTLGEIWRDLLKSDSVNLSDLAEQPLVNCCKESEEMNFNDLNP